MARRACAGVETPPRLEGNATGGPSEPGRRPDVAIPEKPPLRAGWRKPVIEELTLDREEFDRLMLLRTAA